MNGTKAKPKNLRTAPQSREQTLTKGNLALSVNVTSRKPVRVIRGYALNNEYAPPYGYRYDGILIIIIIFLFFHGKFSFSILLID